MADIVSVNDPHRECANWSRLLIKPIFLNDGKVLITLKDAAERILELPAVPSSRVAALRIIEAAVNGGDMPSTQAAVRLALLKHLQNLPSRSYLIANDAIA